jgi:hypothetical protein
MPSPPDDLWTDLDTEVPVLLFPVRLETRFDTRPFVLPHGQQTRMPMLHVRIYPDELSIAPDPERADDPLMARLLPDSWVVFVERPDGVVIVQHIPRPGPDLQVGPSRSATQDAFDPENPFLVHSEDALRWVVDFDTAVQAGMATTFDLATPEEVQQGEVGTIGQLQVDRLVVVGVRGTAPGRTPDTEAAALADLLSAHRVRGNLAFLAQGTPTNNLRDSPSGWTSARVPRAAPQPAAGSRDPAISALRGGTDNAGALEAALGVGGAVFADVDGAHQREQWWARTFQQALFPVTGGEVLATLMRPTWRPDDISPGDAQALVGAFHEWLEQATSFLHDHAASFVRGRGPLPAVRVGRQPYGLLPVVASSRWVRQDGEPPLLDPLAGLLATLRRYFEPAIASVPRVAADGDPTQQLVHVLGHGPVPHPGGYQLVPVTGSYPPDPPDPPDPGPDGPPGTNGGGHHPIVIPPLLRRWLLRRRVLDQADASLAWRGDSLMPYLGAIGQSMLTAPVATSNTGAEWQTPAQYLNALATGLAGFELPTSVGQPRPPDLLFALAEHALAVAGEADAFSLLGSISPERYFGAVSVPVAVDTDAELAAAQAALATPTQPVLDLLPGSPNDADPSGPTLTDLVAHPEEHLDLFAQLGVQPDQASLFVSTRNAIAELAASGLDDDELTRLTGETLACASTRLDAWCTSLAAQRLAFLRDAKPAGIQIGAWGVLVDLRFVETGDAEPPEGWAESPGATVAQSVRPPDKQVGYVHAPSLAQARTAGVLRAGELAHEGDGSSLASLDLTSRRTRTAQGVLTAMANGQPLAALLGYQLERSFDDAGLIAVVPALRLAFPQRRLAGDAGTPAAGVDAVVPDEVMDGLDVIAAGDVAISVARQAGVAFDEDAFSAVLKAAAETFDAVADLLVAEGVHQITSGRYEAAGATFSAIAEGSQPPEITVTREPRSGVTITHRIVQVVAGLQGTSGWDRTAARAVLAPETELWAEELLGPAGTWQVAVQGTPIGLDALTLCALDVVVASASVAGRHDLAQRWCTAGTSGAGDPDALEADETFGRLAALAETLAEVLAGSRPAVGSDLCVAPGQATSLDAGTVTPVPAPAAADLQPIADRCLGVITAVETGIQTVRSACAGLAPTDLLPAELVIPLARAGVAGAGQVPRAGQVSVGLAQAVASAGVAVIRDVDASIDAGSPTGATRAERLSALCSGPDALGRLVRVVRCLAGDPVVPTLPVPSQLGHSLVVGVDAVSVEEWLARMGRVRSSTAALDDLRLFVEASGLRLSPLQAAQLPLVAAEGWLANRLPERDPAASANTLRPYVRPAGPRVHVVVAGEAEVVTSEQLHGLVVDEAVEVLPAPTSTTGLAFYYGGPGARPPQSLLLALHPDPTQPWTWQHLVDTVDEVMALAQLRGVELEDLIRTGATQFLPLTYVRDNLPADPLSGLAQPRPWTSVRIAANRVATEASA